MPLMSAGLALPPVPALPLVELPDDEPELVLEQAPMAIVAAADAATPKNRRRFRDWDMDVMLTFCSGR